MTENSDILNWRQQFPPWLIAVCVALFLMAALANAVMDTLQFRFSSSVFSKIGNERFFNPRESWHNKWKNGDPKQGEAYLGSSTVFVLFTDAWHLAQAIMFGCFDLIIVLLLWRLIKLRWYWWVGLYFFLHFIFGLTFELFFAKLFIV